MDNKTPEIRPSSENPQIPEYWNFPERNQGDALKVIQIDKDEGYLVFNTSSPYGFRSIDYFFNRNGLPLLTRTIPNSSHIIDVQKWGEVPTQYALGYGPRNYLFVNFINPEENSVQPNYAKDFWDDSNFVVFTDQGLIERIRMLSTKLKGPDPDIDFLPQSPLHNPFELHDLHGLKILDQEQPNQLVLGNNEGKKEYVIVWNTVIEQNREGKEIPFFVVTQTRFDADNEGTKKVIRSPIRIDMNIVKSALMSEPPYPKDDKGRLVVPWRNIDRLVGASLSYSYPPQTPQK